MFNVTHTPAAVLAHAMMIEDTGRAMCDSGDIYGRNHERNATLTLDQMLAAPSATLDVSGPGQWDFTPTVSTFHVLASWGIDDTCEAFNALPCDAWDGDHYGTSADQCAWLEARGLEPHGAVFNTYNHESMLSQILQGQEFRMGDEDGPAYLLVQVHGGCDARGGYTDAKLFRIGDGECAGAYALLEDCTFWTGEGDDDDPTLEWRGEWITREGSSADDEDFEAFARALGFDGSDDAPARVVVNGDYSPSEG